jgi:hypothetical protein
MTDTSPPRIERNTYDRRHAVSAEQESAWIAAGKPVHGPASTAASSTTSLWVPQTIEGYAAVLDHGVRSETNGIVIHVNDGYYHGTIGFFTNGQPEPYGSEGVGAHFEMGGTNNKLQPPYEDGDPYQFLPLNAVAWHAVNANGTTIGIEHAGFGWSTAEWETEHYNMIGNSAYRAAWILRRYGLGPPDIQEHDTTKGNVWPHAAGGASWGGHECPASTQNGVDYFPWDLWETYCKRAYNSKWEFA